MLKKTLTKQQSKQREFTMTTIINKINLSDIKEISITAKRWFQKSYGNTYHSVIVSVVVSRQSANKIDPISYPLTERNRDVWIDVAYVPFEYGYGNHYCHTAMRALIEALNDCPEWVNIDNYYHIDRLAKKLGVVYNENVYDVNRKKDL